MSLKTWPYRLLTPSAQQSMLGGSVMTGGRALSGFQQIARMDGGGLWRTTYSNIALRGRDQILAARAWSAHLAGGARSAIIPMWDLGLAPRGLIGGVPALGGLPAPAAAGDWFGWEASFGAPIMVAEFAAAAGLRAVAVQVTMVKGGAPVAGQIFAVEHAVWGWRVYRIEEVTDRDGQAFSLTITPPLREAVGDGDAVEFDVPRCVMTLSPDSAESLEPVIANGRLAGPISAVFVEAGKP